MILKMEKYELVLELVDQEGRPTEQNEVRERISSLFGSKVCFIKYFARTSMLLIETDEATYQSLSRPNQELSDIIAEMYLNRRY